jgi:glutamate-ammonia-ligase adenylyltransferase
MPSRAVIAETSPYFARLLAAKPALAAEIDASLERAVTADELSVWLAAQPLSEASLKPVLRQLKQRAYARIATRDLCGLAPLGEVVEGMTLIAELAVATATRVLAQGLVERYGTPRGADGSAQELIVVGMGKLGGRELNVSSDIDLIFVYPEDGDTDGARSISAISNSSPGSAALINAIADVTEDGQVFRVDMRLRPNGDSGPLVCSFDMLENYFVTQGREWERYAWIKARPLTVAATAPAGAGTNWRRSAVPSSFANTSISARSTPCATCTRRSAQEVAKKDKADNVKLGPGGIREDRIHRPGVPADTRRARPGASDQADAGKVLRLLADNGIAGRRRCAELSAAYEFLRRVEHRLQYLDDAQTHMLPTGGDDRSRSRAPWAMPTSRACWSNWTTIAPTSRATSRPFSPIPIAASHSWPACGAAPAARSRARNSPTSATRIREKPRHACRLRSRPRYQQLPPSSATASMH